MKKNQSETSQSGITLIRGAFFDFLDDPWKYIGREHESARYIRDGLLVVEGGIIKDFGPFDELSPKYPDQPITHIQNRMHRKACIGKAHSLSLRFTRYRLQSFGNLCDMNKRKNKNGPYKIQNLLPNLKT